MSVAVVSCVYGDDYGQFIDAWRASLEALETRPDEIVVVADRDLRIPGAHVFVCDSTWKHPQAFYLQRAISLAWLAAEWAWILDIDDTALPDALNGLSEVEADVWQMGYLRSDGVEHIPPQLTAAEVLSLSGNPLTAGSAVRTDAFLGCGGFPDAAFHDWGLWRRLAQHGATFESSGRAHYRYNRHAATRSAVELLPERRQANVEEMNKCLSTPLGSVLVPPRSALAAH